VEQLQQISPFTDLYQGSDFGSIEFRISGFDRVAQFGVAERVLGETRQDLESRILVARAFERRDLPLRKLRPDRPEARPKKSWEARRPGWKRTAWPSCIGLGL
jgi:hypothetical protein